ncbi:MAG: hypothetical protein LH628_18455 [Microcoleus sp. CAN_BIN18]|nr:hypothetical protein [Microcoleus sp. CAN_BIN18]
MTDKLRVWGTGIQLLFIPGVSFCPRVADRDRPIPANSGMINITIFDSSG